MLGQAAAQLVAIIAQRRPVDDRLQHQPVDHLPQPVGGRRLDDQSVKLAVGQQERIDVGQRPVDRGVDRGDVAMERGEHLGGDAVGGLRRGMTLQHRAQREQLLDVVDRPVADERPLAVAALDEHLGLEPVHRVAHRGSRHAANLGELFLFQLDARRQLAAEDLRLDFVIGAVACSRHALPLLAPARFPAGRNRSRPTLRMIR